MCLVIVIQVEVQVTNAMRKPVNVTASLDQPEGIARSALPTDMFSLKIPVLVREMKTNF